MITRFRRGAALRALLSATFLCGAFAVLTAASASASQEIGPSERRLREQIEARFEVVPLSRGVGLRPTRRVRDLRMIEITHGAIAIDGAPVSGSELHDRIGTEDAHLILQVSYLDEDRMRALFGTGAPAEAEAPSAPRVTPEPPGAPERAPQPERSDFARHRTGERVQVFGSVHVDRDEAVDGEVVAVLGSVRVEGEVSGEVVAVLGSVELGPEARVGGDVTSIGGQVRRAPGSEIRGSIREISMSGVDFDIDMPGGPWWLTYGAFHPFARSARLAGTIVRLMLLMMLASIVVLVARQPVERIAWQVTNEPLKSAVVGFLAELLFGPVLVLTSVILVIIIIGIPLLLVLLPFVVVATLFILLGGFVGTAYSIGGWGSRRIGWSADSPYARVCLGIVVILLPLLVARLFGLVGGPFDLAAMVLVAAALLIEFVVWTVGFGGALTVMFERWRTSRAAAGPATAPPPVEA